MFCTFGQEKTTCSQENARLLFLRMCADCMSDLQAILYINTLSWGPLHASVGYSLRPTRTSSLSEDAVCHSHCYKVLSDPIWWELDE